MVTLTLDTEEQEILRAVLEEVLGDLRMEVAGTDRLDFREMLKHREVCLKRWIAALR